MNCSRNTNEVFAGKTEIWQWLYFLGGVILSGNGYISESEFEKFIEGLGVKMSKGEMALVFNTVDTNKNGKISLSEFTEYFIDFLTDETGQNRPTEVETRLR